LIPRNIHLMTLKITRLHVNLVLIEPRVPPSPDARVHWVTRRTRLRVNVVCGRGCFRG
jgi:hypothetical protein